MLTIERDGYNQGVFVHRKKRLLMYGCVDQSHTELQRISGARRTYKFGGHSDAFHYKTSTLLEPTMSQYMQFIGKRCALRD